MEIEGKTGHFSDEEITLYGKEELSHEDMSRLTKHLEGCEDCKRALAEAQAYSGLMYRAIEADLSNERKKDCLSEIDISAYLERQATAEEKTHIEEHLSNCNYCLSLLVETEKALKEGLNEEPTFSGEKIMETVLKQLREKKADALIGKFAALIKKSPPVVKKTFEAIRDDIETMIKNTFTYPSPRFEPVFGESLATVLSPFGKMRYPIIFEWMPFEGADHYTISVDNTNWSFDTSETRIKVSPKEPGLDYGNEYMWELKVVKGEKIVKEIRGFFSLATEDEIRDLIEIENQLKNIKSEFDRLILWGGILEEKGFYMEAVEQYKKAYDLESVDGIAYRIAYCYDRLELEELRDEWNGKIDRG